MCTLLWPYYTLPFSSSIKVWIMPSLANIDAHPSSVETVPIRMITSRIMSSSAAPDKYRLIDE